MTLGHHSSMIVEHDPPALRGIPGDGGQPGLGPAAGPPGRPRSCFCTPALGPHLQEMVELAGCSASIRKHRRRVERNPGSCLDRGHSGGIFMNLPWERKAIFTQPGRDHLRARKIGISPTPVWFTVCFSALRPAFLSNVSHVASLNRPSCQVSRWICAELPCSLST